MTREPLPAPHTDPSTTKAGDLLSSPEQRYGLGEYSVNIYSQRLQLLGLEQFQELNKYGKSTFFIPVDQAFDVRIHEYLR